MAEIVKNDKNFKVVKMSREEVNTVFGTIGICDRCNKKVKVGYYIAVLNMWMCTKCYKSWLKTARYYEEDRYCEERCFKSVLLSLGML